jgi:hypothetical protein
MALDFPSSPTNGQTFNGYIYDTSLPGWRNVNTSEGIGLQYQSGFVPITPTSVTVSSGSATVNSSGIVTFTSATNINLANVFSSSYKNYKLVFNGLPSGTTEMAGWFSSGGTSITSGWYGASFYVAFGGGSGTNGLRSNGNGGWIGNTQNATYYVNSVLDIYIEQGVRAQYTFASHSRAYGADYFGGYGVDGACDGFRVSPLAGGVTLTGTMRVYGYR